MVSTEYVLSHMLTVVATDSYAWLAYHSSDFQYLWTARYSAGLKDDLRFFPSDCFENLPRPVASARMEHLGVELDAARSSIMVQRHVGLTDLYNMMHSPAVQDDDIAQLRHIHSETNEAVLDAYALIEEQDPRLREFERQVASEPLPSWRSIELDHGFHETQQGVRFTISPQARDLVLDKLLALNHYRYRQEAAQGLHNKKKSRKKVDATKGRPRRIAVEASVNSEEAGANESSFDGLFAPPDALF